MENLKCVIVDDEELARTLLETYINQVPQLELVGKFKSPLEIIPLLNEDRIDLLFLDIHMPEITGIDFLKSLPKKINVIFTTAHKEYALEGYRLDVIDYILKPLEFSIFLQAVNKAIERMAVERKRHAEKLSPDHSGDSAFIMVKSEHKTIRLAHDDIIYIQGMNEYVAFHTTREKRIMSLMSLKKLEQELPSNKFIRVHKSYIVSIDKIEALEGNMLHLGEQKITLGGNYKAEVIKRIF